MAQEPTKKSPRDRMMAELAQLANMPAKSRTQREIDHIKELLELLNLKREVASIPMRDFYNSKKLEFDLAKLYEEIDDFNDPKRHYLKSLRTDVEIAVHERKLEELKPPPKPIPWKLYGILGGVGVLLIIVLGIIAMPPWQKQQLLASLAMPLVFIILVGAAWLLFKLFSADVVTLKGMAIVAGIGVLAIIFAVGSQLDPYQQSKFINDLSMPLGIGILAVLGIIWAKGKSSK